MEDLRTLQQIGCEGAIIGKAIYEGKIELKELRDFIIRNQYQPTKIKINRFLFLNT
jgi:hypothetical protein